MEELKTKVENMVSSKGNKIANQFLIYANSGVYFQSYRSVIAFKRPGKKTQIDSAYWDYSVTTGKYRSQFLNETKKETQAKIDSGEYELTNLN